MEIGKLYKSGFSQSYTYMDEREREREGRKGGRDGKEGEKKKKRKILSW